MCNVHPRPRCLSGEPSLHGHPTPKKKYGLLCTRLGCKSAIKRTVHLLPCETEVPLTHSSVGLVPFPYSLPQQKPTHLRGAASPCIGFAALFFSFLFFFPLLRCIDGMDPSLIAVSPALLLPHHSSEVWFTHALKAEPFLDEIGQLCFTRHFVINLLLRWQE